MYCFCVTPCQVLLCSPTTPVRLLVTPKHGADMFLMYPIGRKPYRVPILLSTRSKLSSKVSETKKMTFFGPVLQISLVQKILEIHQSQYFSTLAEHI
jgi:hypothetical protein